MERYVAFLRAINVGGHRVKMEDLRKLFEELKLANVETFIASGNVIFDASAGGERALEKKIEAHLKQSLGYEVSTFLRTPAELAATLSHPAFPPGVAEGHSVYIGFLHEPPAAERNAKLVALGNEIDEFHVNGREFYWLARKKISESTITGNQIEKALGMPTTMRNVTTVTKLATQYGADAPRKVGKAEKKGKK
jgi:uncharacterized protein (DUF1697 family)